MSRRPSTLSARHCPLVATGRVPGQPPTRFGTCCPCCASSGGGRTARHALAARLHSALPRQGHTARRHRCGRARCQWLLTAANIPERRPHARLRRTWLRRSRSMASSGIADAVGVWLSLALQHALAGHIRRACRRCRVLSCCRASCKCLRRCNPELAVPARIERLLASPPGAPSTELARSTLSPAAEAHVSSGLGIGLASGACINLPAACATASASSAPKIEWVQLLAQQLLITLWRLHRVGAIVAPAAPSRVPLQGATLATQQGRASASATAAPAADAPPSAASRAAGALAPPITRASAKPATRLAPQGALHRLGQSKPSGPALPWPFPLAALIAAPSFLSRRRASHASCSCSALPSARVHQDSRVWMPRCCICHYPIKPGIDYPMSYVTC